MRLKRIQEMSGDEILYRLKDRLRLETDRARFYLGLGIEDDREFTRLLEAENSSLKTYLENGPALRFYSGVQAAGRDKVVGMMMQRSPRWIEAAIEEAGRLLEHRISFMAYSNVSLGDDIDWHKDPISGFRWEPRFWANHDLVNAQNSDPKIIHELNRQQHLPRLARAFFITGEERYAREAVAQMESWIDQNRKWNGVNWQSSLEIAIRSISWMWSLFMLLPSKALDERASRRICKSLFSQIDHVYRYPSTYSSPNTHLIGEAAAVFMAGLIFAELPRATQWRHSGAACLVDEMERQVFPEGVYGEASSYYHCYAADFYLHAMVIARANRFTFPEWMWKRLEKMLDHVLHLTRPDGTIPLIGDDDGGRVFAISERDYRRYRDGLASGAVMFGRPDFKHQAIGFAEESLWLLGAEGWDVFESLTSRPPLYTHRFYKESGCIIQRSAWDDSASHVTFDCGNLGMLSGGHGHADALSLTLFTNGRELLIDPATAVYNCAPEWRNYFRSTRAHNTVVVDGFDQAEPSGTFKWKSKPESTVLQHIQLPGIEYVDARHDGFLRLRQPIIHRRRLIHINPDYWIVLDDLQGSGQHRYDFLYHFAPDTELFVFGDEGRGEVECRARLKSGSAEHESALQMFMYGSGTMLAEALGGQSKPIQGWSSFRYGERKPSAVLRASMHEQTPAAMMTFLIPGCESGRSHQLKTCGSHVIPAVLRLRDYEDIAVQSPAEIVVRLQDYTMQGEFIWIRKQRGVLTQLFAVNTRLFSCSDQIVFESTEPIPYVLAHFWNNGIVIECGGDEGKVYVRDLRDRQLQRN